MQLPPQFSQLQSDTVIAAIERLARLYPLPWSHYVKLLAVGGQGRERKGEMTTHSRALPHATGGQTAPPHAARQAARGLTGVDLSASIIAVGGQDDDESEPVMSEKKKRSKAGRMTGNIPTDLLELIDELFPDGVLQWPYITRDEEYQLDARCRDAQHQMEQLDGVGLFYKQAHDEGPPGWDDEYYDDEDDDDDEVFAASPRWDCTYSYRRFFLGLADPRCQVSSVGEEEDDDGEWVEVERTFVLGCVVGLCEFAPVGVIRIQSLSLLEGEPDSEPQLAFYAEDLEGEPQNAEAALTRIFGARAAALAGDLRRKILDIMEDVRIRVLSDDEAKSPVSWLDAGEGVIAGGFDTRLTVEDVFFFTQP